MRSKFKVPLHKIEVFAEGLEETELKNEILGWEDGMLVVEVLYTREEFSELEQIIDLVGDPDDEEKDDQEEEEQE